ncbi:Transcriptional regulator, DeoR family [hydrothermal vent metagenome]|uniref:Transcriptional regulator, DeoR family n=1 Tax=hydrothermal vent metagenome TaxID=652676 RepID=A0A3B0RTG9_9ZZZZ
MRRADRLLQIIQIFRRRNRITTARDLAEELEVSVRTIYRDMVTLMASGVPITGEARIGYVLEKGYDLPPLMLTIEEIEALVLGARLVGAFSQDDQQMLLATGNALAKIEAVLPEERREQMNLINLVTGVPELRSSGCVDLAILRRIIRTGYKVQISYCDGEGALSNRVIWPLGISYFGMTRMIIAWCESRQAIRNFRLDRIETFIKLETRAPHTRQKLYRDYIAIEKQKGIRAVG